MPKPTATHTDLASFVADKPMDNHPLAMSLLTTIGGVRVSAMARIDCRGLMIAIDEPEHRLVELSLTRPVAVRNAVYRIIDGMGESVRFERVYRDSVLPPWFEFIAVDNGS